MIAHRGASFDAPESTAAAYKLARDLGADYLELDLQRSKDGVLFVLHDDSLLRTTDVAVKFPERKDSTANEFTMAELKTLDAGSWFNTAYPDRARPSFTGLKILTLDEVINIAEGNPLHKPGLYIETKEPKLFPGIERDLKDKLQDRGWLSPAGSKLAKRATGVGQGRAKWSCRPLKRAVSNCCTKRCRRCRKSCCCGWAKATSSPSPRCLCRVRRNGQSRLLRQAGTQGQG